VLARAVATARAADVAVVFVSDVTGEGSDRTSLALPGDQDRLVAAVARANPRTVIVLNTGGPVLTPWLGRVRSVLETWYPGQEYGGAVAALLFGDANPSGKLPMTWPASSAQGPASDYRDLRLTTERYAEGVLVGYRWYDATGQRPLFPFGYGLSYTSFRYGGLRVSQAGGRQAVSVQVTNTGRRAGSEVVQLYLGAPAAAHEPPKQLKGYAKVSLRPGETRTVTFRLGRDDLASWIAGRWVVTPGRYRVLVGGSAGDIRRTGTFAVR
jgi:beta-glucosidase